MNQMSSKTRGLLCVAALAATLLLSPTSALAQEDPQGGAGGSLLLSSTTTAFGGAYVSIIISAIASPLITTGGVITTIVAVLKKQEPVALALYLDENKALAAEAVAFGGGAGVDDLATFFQVSPSNRSAFAAVLVSRRQRLLPLISGEQISPSQALEFATIVTSAMMTHPDLEGDVHAALASFLAHQARSARQ